jgi:hypothetical protein
MSYYVISYNSPDAGLLYLGGTPSSIWWRDEDGRKFKNIGDIRKFITAALRWPPSEYGRNIPVVEWQYSRVEYVDIPASEVLTASHTMGILRGNTKIRKDV